LIFVFCFWLCDRTGVCRLALRHHTQQQCPLALKANRPSGRQASNDNPNAKVGAEQIVRQPNYRQRFDYVFVGSWESHPKTHARVQSAALAFAQPIDGVWASDHFGVVVGLDMEYKVPGTFKGGTILGVAIDVSPEVFLDLQKEAKRALVRD
jgi:hypothetical protein